MKNLLSKALIVFAASATFAHAKAGWLEDIAKAKQIATEQKRPILLDFTGSDWCGWCIKLDKEVFSKKEFKDYAKENLILVEVDFPHNSRQSKKLAEQNAELKNQYKIDGYPSIILIRPDGSVIAQTGYQEGGPAAYVEHLKKLLEKK